MRKAERISSIQALLNSALAISKRSTCARRDVGCIIVDKHGRTLATGYNGTPRGREKCLYSPCTGAGAATGENLDGCGAVHAEQNALMHCRDVMKIHRIILTDSPCVTCAKMIANTSCKTIYYKNRYEGHFKRSSEILTEVGILLKRIK